MRSRKIHVESNQVLVVRTLVEPFLIVRLTTFVAVRLESFSSYIRLKLLEVMCISSESSSFRSRVGSFEGKQNRL